jgi:hypothetical protein
MLSPSSVLNYHNSSLITNHAPVSHLSHRIISHIAQSCHHRGVSCVCDCGVGKKIPPFLLHHVVSLVFIVSFLLGHNMVLAPSGGGPVDAMSTTFVLSSLNYNWRPADDGTLALSETSFQ